METTQEAIDKLAALVDAPKWLEDNGYCGIPYASDMCVVAAYLGDKTGVQHTCWNNIAIPVGGSPVTIPDHIAHLMLAFDRGDYPRLVA